MYKEYILKIKKLYNKFLKLPIYYKVLTSILMSLLLHFSFSLLFYIGLYNYTHQYNIPFILIEELNLNLLIVPLYFDALVSTLAMIFIMFFTIIMIRFGPTLKDLELQDKKIKIKRINYYILKLYKWCKIGNCKFQSKKYILFTIYSSFFILILVILALSLFIFSIDGVFKFLIILIPSILMGIILESTLDKDHLKVFLLSTILFLLLSFTVALTSHGVKIYLEKTNLGGEIPISIKIKKDFHDGYLILMTKETILLMDVNKSIISEIPRKLIEKINYPIMKEKDKFTLFHTRKRESQVLYGKYNNNSNSSNSSKWGGEVTGLSSPFDFNRLHN